MFNKFCRIILASLCCTLALIFCSCNFDNIGNIDNVSPIMDLQTFERDSMDFSSVQFTPWDTEDASRNIEKREPKPYTIMIFMNGSDLESNIGAATIDLIEMLDSGLQSQNANIVVFTGGAKKWLNNVVPSDTCVIWELADGYIYKIADIGLKNMGDPGTLAGFIDFSIANFPAQKYGLIFWDHGGGSIAGFGSDEKFSYSNLTLLDINCALEKSVLKDTKLEFIGFDACLMAAVEMGVVAAPYAEYLIASEDLEPGDGWDYSFLSVLNTNPLMDGKMLGKAIVDYFINYYGKNYYGDLTLSVIDLKNVSKVMHSIGELMKLCSESLKQDKAAAYSTLSQKRYSTKTFGSASPLNNAIDMVDIGDMAEKLKNDYPEEAARTLTALKSCVVYNRHNSSLNLSGLSSYYIYGGKSTGTNSLKIYSDLKMSDSYTLYLNDFFKALTGKTQSRSSQHSVEPKQILHTDLTLWKKLPQHELYIQSGIINNIEINETEEIIKNLVLPRINGHDIVMFEISSSEKGKLYSVPMSMNDEDSELIILINSDHQNGKILGRRRELGFKIQKGYDKIQIGDKISFYNKTLSFGNDTNDIINASHGEARMDWHKSNEFILTQELTLDWAEASDDTYYSIMSTDIHNTKNYSPLQPLHRLKKVA